MSKSECFRKNTLWSEQESAGNIPEMRITAEFFELLEDVGSVN